jgi:hypothetical protein
VSVQVKRAEKMALSAKDLDPLRIYSNAPKLWDFVLLTLLLFYTIKKSFITVRAMRQHGAGKEVMGAIFGGGGGTEHKQTDNTISFILALMMSIGLMRYSKFSLEFAFTSGILPFFAAFILGMGAYSYFLGVMGPDKRLVAGAIGGFVGLLAFSALWVASGGQHEWVYVLLWFLALLIFLSFLKGHEEKAIDTSRTVASAAGSVNDTIKGAADLERRAVDVGKRTDEIEEKSGIFLEILKELRTYNARASNVLRAAAAAAAIVAGATQAGAASPAANRPAIVQQLIREGVPRAEAESAADQITFVESDAPVAPPGLKSGPAPEGVVSEAEVTFAAVPPVEVAGSIEGILKEVNDELDRRRPQFGAISIKPAKKLAEAVVRNYVEFGYWNARALTETLTKQGSKGDAASFVQFLGKKANEVFKIVHGQVVPKGAGPVKVVPKFAPQPDQVRPPQKNEELVKQSVKINVQKLELAQSQLLQQIQSFIKISELLNEIPNYVPQLKKSGDKAQSELSKLHEESKKLAKKAESPDYNTMLDYAKSLESACSTLAATLAGANNTFNDGLKPLSSFLITDERALKNLVNELNGVLPEFKSAIEDMKARSDELKDKGATQDIMAPYSAAFDKVDNLIVRVINSVEQHAKDIPETLKTSLEGFIPILQSYQNSLKYVVPQVQALKSRWAMINEELAKIEKEKKSTETAVFTANLETAQIKKDSQTLDSIVTGLVRPVGESWSKDLDMFKDNAALALQILERLERERMKIVGLPAHTKSTTVLGNLLGTLRGTNLRNDLVEFVNSCDAASKADDAEAGKIIKAAIVKFQTRETQGETYEDFIGGLTRAILISASNVSKEIASPPPPAA